MLDHDYHYYQHIQHFHRNHHHRCRRACVPTSSFTREYVQEKMLTINGTPLLVRGW
jgi:hypothetical protein